MITVPIRYKGLVSEIDRHGKRRFYVRLGQGRRLRIRAEPGSEEFRLEYDRAIAILQSGETPAADSNRPVLRKVREGSFRAAYVAYQTSGEWKTLDPETQKQRRRLFEAMCEERIDRNAPEPVMADCPLSVITDQHIRMLRDRVAEAPEQANHRLKALRHFFKWAVPAFRLRANPTNGVERFNRASTGHHTWTEVEIAQYLAHHGPGTQARLAFALAFWTGLRVSDLHRVGPQHVKDGRLRFDIFKNRNRKPVQVDLAIHPVLEAVIRETPTKHLTFLVTQHGKPFTSKGLSNRVKDWCIAAGLPHCSAHGIRKGSATVAAEGGASEHMLMALYAWTSPKQAALYTKKARQKPLSDAAVKALSENKIPHLFGMVPESEGETTEKASNINDR